MEVETFLSKGIIGMEVRRARIHECGVLSDIALRSKAHWGYEDSFIEACREALTITKKDITRNHVYVLEDNASIVGFFSLVFEGERKELDALFIAPEYIGKGYGRILWESILDKAKQLGMDEFTLDADPYAEGFYIKMGAVRIGEVDSTVLENRKLPLMKVIL